MRTIVIADGLTKDYLGAEEPFAGSRRNVGRAEIDRLLGRGKAHGRGPLPAFLRAVVESSKAGADLRLILLRGEEPVPEVLDPILKAAQEISAEGGGIPWRRLWEELSGDDATDPMPYDRDGACDRFVVVGCHTERRIFSLALYLRHVLGSAEVAVSPHLVGSATPEAHFAALRHNFPSAGVKVLLDLAEVADFSGLDPAALASLDCHPPRIGPNEARDALTEVQQRILERLCLNWTRVDVRPLAGGFSGSLLMLADGWKGEARTEPLVLKVDEFAQMRRELDGYHQVKDFFGKHVPTFGYPIVEEDSIGVGMELAAMEGSPGTLQGAFEEADSDETLSRFLFRLDKALALLSEKLYRNTRESTWVVPYRNFGLHAENQVKWLVQNSEIILSYLADSLPAEGKVDPRQLGKLLRLVAANPDGIRSETCLVHGDLNYANIIGDEGDNIWFIDWTHTGFAPIELDFAKLESDAKFVMSKAFDAGDLSRLRVLEEYLLEQRIPGRVDSLPEKLKFVKWDLRFRKVLETVRRVRQACFDLKASEDWLIYRAALLRYSTHTLSFDKRRDRGECDPTQLMHALYATEALIFDLVADDFHLKIRAERAEGYPPRQRISIDEAPWVLDCESYDPPYHVDPALLENDRSRSDHGWADPEEIAEVLDLPRVASAKYKDEQGRPRNPRGRTGLAGRGLLGLWGANLSVGAVVIRTSADGGYAQILLGREEDAIDLHVMKGFVLPEESPEAALRRVLSRETGWDPGGTVGELVFEGYTYDPRQTDNAWVESRAFLIVAQDVPPLLEAGGEFDEVKWWPLEAETVNRIPADQARIIRESIPFLEATGVVDAHVGEGLLASTG
jgi:ADP-ribose pyrophosphatase